MTAEERRRLELYRAECESLPSEEELLDELRMENRRQIREAAELNILAMLAEYARMVRVGLLPILAHRRVRRHL